MPLFQRGNRFQSSILGVFSRFGERKISELTVTLVVARFINPDFGRFKIPGFPRAGLAFNIGDRSKNVDARIFSCAEILCQ